MNNLYWNIIWLARFRIELASLFVPIHVLLFSSAAYSELRLRVLAYGRNPLLTIKANCYHFCKLSLVKKASTCVRPVEESACFQDAEAGETPDSETQNGSGGRVEGSLAECSHASEGLFSYISRKYIDLL